MRVHKYLYIKFTHCAPFILFYLSPSDINLCVELRDRKRVYNVHSEILIQHKVNSTDETYWVGWSLSPGLSPQSNLLKHKLSYGDKRKNQFNSSSIGITYKYLLELNYCAQPVKQNFFLDIKKTIRSQKLKQQAIFIIYNINTAHKILLFT